MPWNKNNFPNSMKNLDEPIREKAIEIGNALLNEGYDVNRAIPIAISQAKAWYDNRGNEVSPDITHHLTAENDGWVLKSVKGDEEEKFKTKEEAMDHIKKKAKTKPMKVMIHGVDGKFQEIY
ncbi:MAG: DUF2188 domain-containing protein [Clostridiaceae bacterium]